MNALDRKLLRSFRRLWPQAVAIALVLACGVAILLTTFGMYGALEETRTAYYQRNRFADVFAAATRAPRRLLDDIRAIDGVRRAEGRISRYAVLDIAGRDEVVTARILSLPDDGPPLLNRPLLRQGRLPDPGASDEAVLNAPFAAANGLRPGDAFAANLGGRKRRLRLTGTVLSPEFIYTIGPGALMPDNERFAILWMPQRALAAAYDMQGAFDSVTLTLDPGAREAAVIARLDDLLARYGGLGAHGRDRQLSHAYIDAEIQQLRNMALILPPIFFAISVFLVGMVIDRIVTLERGEIGLLKAIGYSNAEVCVHFLLLAGLIAVAGIALGWGAGTWLSRGLARLYAQFFDFPYIIYRVSYQAYAISGVLALLSAAAGAARSALRAARLPPAVAMSPPAPPHFKRSLLDRGLAALHLSQTTMMILRSMIRWPLRAALSALGLALAVAVLIASTFFSDALDMIIDTAFYQGNRQNAALLFDTDLPETALADIAQLPGVLRAEGQLVQVVRLRNGHLQKEIALEGRRPGAELSRIIDGAGAVVEVPPEGLLLSRRLADQLAVRPGERIEVELLGEGKEILQMRVAGIVTQYLGLGAYMNLAALNRLLRQAPQISTANLLVDPKRLPELHRALKEMPVLGGLVLVDKTHGTFRNTIRENIIIMTGVYVVIALLITIGVAYNGARILLSERARELASLRILGFTRGEVSFVLIGETMLLAVLAQPPGWALGAAIAAALAHGSASDLYAIPLVLKPAAFARASLIVLAAALGAALIVRRRLDRLDLVQVMKTRE